MGKKKAHRFRWAFLYYLMLSLILILILHLTRSVAGFAAIIEATPTATLVPIDSTLSACVFV